MRRAVSSLLFFAVGATWFVASSCGTTPSVATVPAAGSCDTKARGAGASCGPDAVDDCCAAASVSGGKFTLGVGNDGFGIAGATPTVSPFRFDTYEVTVGRFRTFVGAYDGWKPVAGGGAHPKILGSGWQAGWPLSADSTTLKAALLACAGGTWTDASGANEGKPITCITWYELFAFCTWDGGRIPTMTEHAYVAYGGDEQRSYPWSVPPDAGIDDQHAVYTPEGGAPRAAPEKVGSRPAGVGKWGQLDLAGNAGEWVLDKYPPDPFPVPATACVDCAVIAPPITQRVVQGGSYTEGGPNALQSFYILGADPLERHPTRGGRCAR